MKINSISAMSYNKATLNIKQAPQNYGSAKNIHNAENTIKNIMPTFPIGLATVMAACKQMPKQPVKDSEIKQTDIKTVQDTEIYKIFNNFGFDVKTEKFDIKDGQYTPKTGDITSLSYKIVDKKTPLEYNFTLDRENSTENNIVYKLCFADLMYKRTYDSANNLITVDKKEKSIDIYDADVVHHYKYILGNDGTLTNIESIGDNSTTNKISIGKNSLYHTDGQMMVTDIKIKLAE